MWTGLNWLRTGSILESLANTETKLWVPYSTEFIGKLKITTFRRPLDSELDSSNPGVIFKSP